MYLLKNWCYLFPSDKEFWFANARSEIDKSLKYKWNTRQARNVVMFVGDGMGINTITASRIYKAGEFGKLSFEQFPHVGLMKVSKKYPQIEPLKDPPVVLPTPAKLRFSSLYRRATT